MCKLLLEAGAKTYHENSVKRFHISHINISWELCKKVSALVSTETPGRRQRWLPLLGTTTVCRWSTTMCQGTTSSITPSGTSIEINHNYFVFGKEAAIWGETKASGRVGETFAQPCHEHEHTSCEVSFLSHKYTNTNTQPCRVSFPPSLIIWSDFY